MSFAKTKAEAKELTPELAREFAHLPPLAGERQLKPKRIKFFHRHIQNGTFIGRTWTVAVHRETGTRYRADGQHSSAALAQLPAEEFPADLTVSVEEIEFDDITTDGPEIFNLFDNPASVRNNTDMMGVYRAQYPDLEDMDRDFLVWVVNGIALAESVREGGVQYPPRDRGLYWKEEEYRNFAQWLWEFRDTPHSWMLKSGGLVASMLEHGRRYQPEAREFWRLVLSESHPDPDHETRELSRDLLNIKHRPRYNQDTLRREATKAWKRYLRLHIIGPAVAKEAVAARASEEAEAAPLL